MSRIVGVRLSARNRPGYQRAGVALIFGANGRLAQLVQSTCLTSRGSLVRIQQRPSCYRRVSYENPVVRRNGGIHCYRVRGRVASPPPASTPQPRFSVSQVNPPANTTPSRPSPPPCSREPVRCARGAGDDMAGWDGWQANVDTEWGPGELCRFRYLPREEAP